jgi:hypothetical protein
MRPAFVEALFVALLGVAVAACASDDAPVAPPLPGIGPAGGTVTGPDGSKVVVPAGALATNTPIAIAKSSAGAPALPAGVEAVGGMYAFTPHGTSFAVPVTVSVPFDPVQVPADATALLAKTNAARDGWEVVANASIEAGSLTGQISSFSWITGFRIPRLLMVQPPTVTANEGQAVTFSATPNFFTYQWQRSNDRGGSWTGIPAATAQSYRIPATKAGDATIGGDDQARFRVVATWGWQGFNFFRIDTSNVAFLTVVARPVIVAHPVDVVAVAGADVAFAAGAEGHSLAYQWQEQSSPNSSFADLAGSNSSILGFTNVPLSMNGRRYRATISNPAGADTTYAALLTVTAAPSGSCVANTQTVLQDDFSTGTQWTASTFRLDGTASHTVAQTALGGNPAGGFRRMAHTLGPPGGTSGASYIWVAHRFTGASYDPAVSGEICELAYSEDQIDFSNPIQVMWGVALFQNGQVFYHRPTPQFNFTAWTPQGPFTLKASDFSPAPGPDFSPTGKPIQFGYFRANSTSIPPTQYTAIHGIDNWRFEVKHQSAPGGVPVSITCTSAGQLCDPKFSQSVTTATGTLKVEFTTSAGHCADMRLHVFVNNVEQAVSGRLPPNTSTGLMDVSPGVGGTYTVELQAEGFQGGCNTGRQTAWAGTARFSTS